MYTSYSTLQRKQLSKQVYTDTQSTYLLVYAPGRHKALQAALQNQLHRKFRLVTQLEDELTPDVAGVLLVSEDVECTPTALTYFAAALREGADLAVCDASFGFDGSTALYLSTRHLPGSSCALVSRALLDKVRAAARGKDSVTELLRLAHAMAQHSRCIPQALLHFRRELCADDVFSAKGRRALILSHELTMTGAPIVLTQRPNAAGVQEATQCLQEAMERLQEELYQEMKPKYRKRAAEFHRRFRETTLRRQREQQKGERNHDA